MSIKTNSLITAVAAICAAQCIPATSVAAETNVPAVVAMEAAYQGLAMVDMGTTLDIRNHASLLETNPILGSHPSQSQIVTYFIVTGALHAAVTYELVNRGAPPIIVKGWEYVTIGIEAAAVGNNYSLGLRVRF